MALQGDAKIRVLVSVDVARDDGVAVAERRAQLALHAVKILHADKGEGLNAGDSCLGVDGLNVDLILALGEIGNQVAGCSVSAAVREREEAEAVRAGSAGKNIPASE